MTRSNDQRIADIIDACGELDAMVALRAAATHEAPRLLAALTT